MIPLTITIAQLNPTIGQLAQNAQQILRAANQAFEEGSQLLLTPELSLCGYPPKDLLLNDSFVDLIQQHLAQLAQDLPPQLPVLVGTIDRNLQAKIKGEKPLFNSVALLHQGSIQRQFYKRLLPNYDVFDEHRYFQSGNDRNWFILEPNACKIGVTICEDFWNDEVFWGQRHYPVDPIAEIAKEKVDVIVNLAASPYTVGKQKFRENLLIHGAKRYQCPIFYVNQVGGNDDLVFDGHSVAIAADGAILARSQGFVTSLVTVQMPVTESSNPDTQPHQKPITLPTVPIHPNPRIDPRIDPRIHPLSACAEAEIWQALVLGVQDYVRKCGFRQIVLGLSGGIDSALVATIAAAAVSPQNVLAVLMPSPYSSDHSISDALALVDTLGIQSTTLPIESMMQSFEQTLNPLFTGREPDVTEENLQSRIRGTLLMAIANKFGHLLLSTGNKSEMSVGYCTLYGDMDGGLAAIADVPKTQVYKLCEWINQQGSTIVSDPFNPRHLPTTSTNTTSINTTPTNTTPTNTTSINTTPTSTTSTNTTPTSTTSTSTATNTPCPPLIPVNILTKPPSAELKPGQVDQDSLPDYDTLDAILDRLLHHHQSVAEVVAAGFEDAIVQRVWKLVMRSEFKRKQAAPGLKITDRAFGTGWRMPIASQW